jgi:hypothetical protein
MCKPSFFRNSVIGNLETVAFSFALSEISVNQKCQPVKKRQLPFLKPPALRVVVTAPA